jgi:hypothetical protein
MSIRKQHLCFILIFVHYSKNGYVRLSKDVHYYSVPYQYIGKKVKILYSSQDVEVYFRYELIAKHGRDTRRYQYTTDSAHLASQHQFLTEWCPESFLKRATEIHEDVASYIAKVLELKPFPSAGLQVLLGYTRVLPAGWGISG